MAKFNGEILHFTAVRLRVNGSGNLQLNLKSLDDVQDVPLANLALVASTNREPTRLANYVDQRGYLQLQTTLINEWFVISKITLFVKPMYTSYPG